MSKLWPEVASVHVRLERAVHAVAVAGPGPRLSVERGLGLQLPAKCLRAFEVRVLLLGEQVPGLVGLVRGACLVTALGGGPGALGEAPAEAVLGLMALVVMGKILGPTDSPALGLAGVSRHDVLIPVQQAVVPVTLFVDPDLVAATNWSCCWRWCLCGCCCGLWSGSCGN